MKIFGLLLLTTSAFADWTIRYRSGEQLLEQGKSDEAIRELQQARAERPGHPAILDALGRAETLAGRYRKALRYFEEAARIPGPDRATILSNLTVPSMELGEYRRAEAAAREALALRPENVRSRKLLAQSLQLQYRFREAKVMMEEILTVQRDPDLLSDLATVYQAEQEYGKAVELLELAAAGATAGQARVRILANLGMAQWQAGMREASVKSLRAALAEAESSVGPNHPDTATTLDVYGKVLRLRGEKAESKRVLERAAAIRGVTEVNTNGKGLTVDWRDLGRR